MRRKDREMSEAFGLSVIDEAPFGTLSINDSDSEVPYAVPLSIVRSDDLLFFHAARSGKKHELFRNHTPVRIVFVGHAKVPDLFSEKALASEVRDGRADTLLSKVFTTEYRSAIVVGTIRLLDREREPALFKEALHLISEKYTPDKMAYFEAAFASGAKKTDVFEVKIESITAKRKQFSSTGEELKWQKAME
ncbi:MAG TPA: pyridoxamine 5'-phosphate oxidase family protein [Fastidiosipila sp.]|nr:pyridoxamine 5'-phosphate oxidase family protein [Fastidiosipila sp.]